jgi:hypothetical protein
MQYALIIDNRVQELFANAPTLASSFEVVEVDDSVGENWTRAGGVFSAPVVVADYVQEARSRLYQNDVIFVRCGKAGVAYPSEWFADDVALRAIVAGTAEGPLPTAPTKPTGI